MKSVMSHNFSQVPEANIPRSSFDRSFGHKTTFDSGYLIPIFVDEALPGDTLNLKMTALARMSTPIVPIMDNIFLDSFFFAVPIRLIWNNWQKFNGEQDNPGDSTDYLVPYIAATASTGYAVGSIHDYMGLPTGVANYHHSALWHRAYNLIWNQWFRDENKQDSVTVNKGDGPDAATDYTLLRRGKRFDYFTSCMPSPQKGTAVTIPLGTYANVVTNSQTPNVSTPASSITNVNLNALSSSGNIVAATAPAANAGIIWGSQTGMRADLSTATAATINSLRQAFQIQRLYERDMRGGTRYTEVIRAHFGVISPDARLQRPEYLGGGSTPIIIHPIAQTSSSDATSPQGHLAAMGTVSASGHGFVKGFTEHCVIIGLVSVRADLNYQQGLNRMFSRRTRYDFYWPALSHLGEQAVLNKEIYCNNDSNDDLVFGYQERYAEYRYKPSQITGKFRSTASGTLDVWHLAQKFTSLPTLNSTFIQENPPINRVVAVNTEPQFIFDSYFKYICARPMPVYSVPGLIDHF